MITGTITHLRPQIRLNVRGPGGGGIIEFTVDTGYQGTLTLAEDDCAVLQLPFVRATTFLLADGTPLERNVYRLTTEWDSRERDVEILALGEEPLLGATMLKGYELCLNYETDTLTIKDAQQCKGAIG